MLKQAVAEVMAVVEIQPPSGGCVLKLGVVFSGLFGASPAAFGRLCVETAYLSMATYPRVTSRLRAAVC